MRGLVPSMRNAAISSLKKVIRLAMGTRLGEKVLRLASEEREIYLHDHGVERISRQSLELYLGCLSRDETDEANLEHALPTLERAANRPDGLIDEAVRREFARTTLHLCKEEAA